MKKTILYLFTFIFLISSVMAISLDRTISTSNVNLGDTFTVSYNVQDADGAYFFSILDSISGGCTVLGSSEIVTTLTSPVSSLPLTVQAPNYDSTCIFEGDWKFGSADVVLFNTGTVSVGGGNGGSTTEPTITEGGNTMLYILGGLGVLVVLAVIKK